MRKKLQCALVALLSQLSFADAQGQTRWGQFHTPLRRVRGATPKVVRPSRPVIPVTLCEAAADLESRRGPGCRVRFFDGASRSTLIHGLGPRGGTQSSLQISVSDPAARQAVLVAATLDLIRTEHELLAVPDPDTSLVVDKVHTLKGLNVVRFYQQHEGLRILGTEVIAQFDGSDALRSVFVDSRRQVRVPLQSQVSREQAIDAAARRVREGLPPREGIPSKAELCILPDAAGDRLVWDVWVLVEAGPFRVIVDAGGGGVIRFANMLVSMDCTPKPRGDAYTVSPVDGPPVLTELPDLDCQETRLRGDFVRSFNWTGGDLFFEEPAFEFGVQGVATPEGVVFSAADDAALAQTTVYFHATEVHRFFAELGFTALDRPLPAFANVDECFGSCTNAFYSPFFPFETGSGAIFFGRNAEVNLGLDPDVIAHEYGHAVVQETAALGTDFFDPDFFYSLALNEGYADFFSASYSADPALGEYFARGLNLGDFLRSVDNSLTWPGEIDVFNPHDTGQIWSGALWQIGQAFSAGGSDADGLVKTHALALATLASLSSDADLLAAAAVLVATAEAMDLSDEEQQTVQSVLVDRGLITGDGGPPTRIQQLVAGDQISGEILAAEGAPVRLSSVQYQVESFLDLSRIVFELEGTGELDLYVRYGTPVVLEGETVVADFSSEGVGAQETIDVSKDSTPSLRAGVYFVAIANRGTRGSGYTLQPQVEFGPFEPYFPLAPGEESEGIVFSELDFFQFTFVVPEVTDKQLTLNLEGDEAVDVFVRFEAPVVWSAQGQIAADVVLRSPETSKSMRLDALTIPALQAGTYFIGTGVRDADVVGYSIVADLLDVAVPAPTISELSPGAARSDTLPAASASVGQRGDVEYAVNVPGGAVALEIRVSSATDVALHVRAGEPVAFERGILAADFSSNLPASGEERVRIDFASSPSLAEGTYHVALVNHETEEAAYTIEVTLDLFSVDGVVGEFAEAFSYYDTAEGAIDGAPRIASTQRRFVLDGPSPGIDVILSPENPGNVDLYLRRGFPVQLVDGVVIADWRSEGPQGDESISLLSEEVVPGSYYVALVNRESADVTAELFAGYTRDPPFTIRVEDGESWTNVLGGCGDCCIVDRQSFAIDVPPDALGLEVAAETPEGDFLDVLPRFGKRPTLGLGTVSIDEDLFVPMAPFAIGGDRVQVGTYFFTVRHCGETEQPFEISFRIARPPPEEQTVQNEFGRISTIAGVPEGFSGQLHRTQYVMDVPPDQGELVFGVFGGDCAEFDVDLLVHREVPVLWDPSTGETNATWRSETFGPGGESVVVSNPAPGRYYGAVVNRESDDVPIIVRAAVWRGESTLLPTGEILSRSVEGEPMVRILQSPQYQVYLSPGSAELSAILEPLVEGGNLDLLARYTVPVALADDGLARTEASEGDTSFESILLPGAGECIVPGYYFFAIINSGDSDQEYTFRADVQRGACQALQREDQVDGVQPSLGAGILSIPESQYCLNLAGIAGFHVALLPRAAGPAHNLDLYVRRDNPVAFGQNQVTADYSAESPGVTESVTIGGQRFSAGAYYVAVTSRGSATTDFTLAVRPLEELTTILALGVEENRTAEESLAEGVPWLAPEQFRVEAPAGVEGLRVELETGSPTSAVRLHVRRGRRVEVLGDTVLSDVLDGRPGQTKAVELAGLSGVYYVAVENVGTRSVPFQLRVDSTAKLVRRGDVDEDGAVDIGDPLRAIFRLFVSPVEICVAAANADGIGGFGITDAIYLLNFLFLGGPPPVAPFPQCSAVAADTEECTSAGCF